MKKDIADALVDFYQKILKPDLDAIREKQVEHDQRFTEVFGHFDTVYKRLDTLEDEHLVIINRLDRMEKAIRSGEAKGSELEKRVDRMKEELTVLQARLESIEQQLKATSD